MQKQLLTLAFIFISLSAFAGKPDFKPTKLLTEYMESPLGVETQSPRFSWRMEATGNRRGLSQSAYRIVVKNENDEQVWDSGKVMSDNSLNVRYEGLPLTPMTAYDWELSVWNDKGQMNTATSTFETGLMCVNDADPIWSGAKWIGLPDNAQPLYSQYLTVFGIDFCIELDKRSGTTHASLVYGANDRRLMDSWLNIQHLKAEKDSSYVEVELDISPLEHGEDAVMNFYRKGYSSHEAGLHKVASMPLPASLVNSSNCNDRHRYLLKSNFGITELYIYDSDKPVRIGEVELNPLGRGGDFIAFPALAEVGYRLDAGQIAKFSDVRVRHYREPSNVIAEIPVEAQSGGFAVSDPTTGTMPLLVSRFWVDPAKNHIRKARLYCTARGIYDVHINGKLVNESYFNPGVSQYNKEHFYQVYDVTDMLENGDNGIAVSLGEGWWSGEISMTGELWNYFGDRQSFFGKIEIVYDDGSRQEYVTNPDSWYYSTDNQLIHASMYNGEIVDARKSGSPTLLSMADESLAGMPHVEVIDIETTKTTHYQPGWEPAYDYSAFKLTAQQDQAVKALKVLSAISVEEVKPGVFVYDMGQNFAGVPEITVIGAGKGQKLHLRYSEMTYPRMDIYGEDQGMIMYENYRAAQSHDQYICAGDGLETFSPRHTLHGYRYIEIRGLDKALPLDAVRGYALTSIDKVNASYECSNRLVNRLWENILWSTYSNFMSIPTDCPQRNERLGWSGDIMAFAPTATYIASLPNFLRRHLSQMRHCQRADGRYPYIAPLSGGFGGFLWECAGLTVAWDLWCMYGDRDMLAEHYDSMRSFISHAEQKYFDPESGVLVQEPGWNLGDWLGLEDSRNDRGLMWDAYWIYNLDLLATMASVLDKEEDADAYCTMANNHRKHFTDTYIESFSGKTLASGYVDGKKGDLVDTQTSYVLPLAFGVIKDARLSKKVSDNLINAIMRENRTDDGVSCPPYSLMTGFIGTSWINQVLSDAGHSDVAYRLLTQTEYPSWLYPITQGATTIWERLNSYTHHAGFGGNNRMNSFNHYSFGAVGSWLLGYSLGIRNDSASPAFKHFYLHPEIDSTGEISNASGHYDSLYGLIESSWSRDGDGLVKYDVTVPPNTTATLTLDTPLALIKEGGRPLKKQKGVELKTTEDDKGSTTIHLQSGKYSFTY